MWPEDLFDFILAELAEEITTADTTIATQPMSCDRWIARSALQKAIRRGEANIALAALATLLDAIGAEGLWRHLTVIALEDLGVAGIDTVARVVAAGRNPKWRKQLGGDWRVASVLVRRMAAEKHCQAACDLLMRLTNDPLREGYRIAAMDRSPVDLVDIIRDSRFGLTERRRRLSRLVAGLRKSNPSIKQQPFLELWKAWNLVLMFSSPARQHGGCVATQWLSYCLSSGWKWIRKNDVRIEDDAFVSAELIGGVPNYAVDQFTRGWAGGPCLLSPKLTINQID